jgi:hypothetical protein
MAVHSSLKRIFRFSIATLLFAMLCVCGYFSGQRSGYRSGFDAGLQGGEDHARLFVKEYEVTDLVFPRNPSSKGSADYRGLIELLHTSVAPETWTINGAGRGNVQLSAHTSLFTRNASVLITQSQEVHAKIAGLFKQLRTVQAGAAPR